MFNNLLKRLGLTKAQEKDPAAEIPVASDKNSAIETPAVSDQNKPEKEAKPEIKHGMVSENGHYVYYQYGRPYTGIEDRRNSNTRQTTIAVFINGERIGGTIALGRGGNTLGGVSADAESYRQNRLLNAAQAAQRQGDQEKFETVFNSAMREKELLDNPEFTELMIQSYQKAMKSWNTNKDKKHFQEIFDASMQPSEKMVAPKRQEKISTSIDEMKNRVSTNTAQSKEPQPTAKDAPSQVSENPNQQVIPPKAEYDR